MTGLAQTKLSDHAGPACVADRADVDDHQHRSIGPAAATGRPHLSAHRAAGARRGYPLPRPRLPAPDGRSAPPPGAERHARNAITAVAHAADQTARGLRPKRATSTVRRGGGAEQRPAPPYEARPGQGVPGIADRRAGRQPGGPAPSGSVIATPAAARRRPPVVPPFAVSILRGRHSLRQCTARPAAIRTAQVGGPPRRRRAPARSRR